MQQNPTPVTPSPAIIAPKTSGTRTFFFIIGGAIIILVIGAGVFYFVWQKLNKASNQSGTLNSTISDTNLPGPLFEVSGVIEQINGDQLKVSENIFHYDTTPITNGTAPKPETTEKKTYIVQITPQTEINITPATVSYSLKVSTPSASSTAKGQLSDLKVGQAVIIVSKEDLRKVNSNQFEAKSVTVSPGLTTFWATVINLSGNRLTVKVSSPAVPEAKEYQLVLTDKTEIVASNPALASDATAKKSQLPQSDLKKDTQIVVYTDKDINLFEDPKALKIEIISEKP